ncbi:MAG: hypothetical protein AB8B69_19385 [Chitinophagales bacterium]
MNKTFSILVLLSVIFVSATTFSNSPKAKQKVRASWNSNTPVAEILKNLGGKVADHGVANPTAEMIQQGEDLVLRGVTMAPNGNKTPKQSKNFVCTHCHNVQKEDPNLALPNPENRLEYAMKHDLPFLQGTTMYGVVNRTSWYNDDYEKKYGDLVKPARNNLREAVQLCAVECSQGRKLKEWELNSVIAYLWTLQLKAEDLNLSATDWEKLKGAENDASMAEWLQKQYFQGSPATFVDAYNSIKASDKLEGNTTRGKSIYELSCLHCHAPQTYVTNLTLDDSQLTFKFLRNNFGKYNHYSLFQLARFGTYPSLGYRPYMPNYTLERMSHQQMADLKAYIIARAED